MPSFYCVETTTKSRVGHTTECNYQKKICVVGFIFKQFYES